MTHVTCGLTAKNRDQLRNPALGNRVWANFTFFSSTVVHCSGRYLNLRSPLSSVQIDVVENGGDRRQPPRYLDPDGRQKARKVDKVSRRMFPMTFILFNIVYWILYSVPFGGFNPSAAV